ncbi:MAG: hypothetical protein AAFP90_15810 [Planctomycetota bacterium]
MIDGWIRYRLFPYPTVELSLPLIRDGRVAESTWATMSKRCWTLRKRHGWQ